MAGRQLDVNGLHVRHEPPAVGNAPATDNAPSRPPLLLVHGAGHGAWCWDNWMRVLPEKGWECFALSLRGHTGSYSVDKVTYCTLLTVSDYAEDVRQVAGKIGRPSVIIGHSMGGITTLQYIAEQTARGQKEAAAVLLASASPGQLGPLRDAPIGTDQPYSLDAETARERYFFSTDKAVSQPAIDQLVPESPSVMNDYSLGDGVPISPGDLPCPVLVVSAEHDGSAAPSDGRIADYLGADYHFAAGIGHNLMLDAGWEPVLDKVESWLAAQFPAL